MNERLVHGGVEARAAALADRGRGGDPSATLRVNERLVQSGLEFAFGEELESAQALGEFERGQAALAIEFAKKIVGGALALLRIALQTCGDQVSIRISAEAHAGHDVVEALHAGREHAEAVEAAAVFAAVDGLAQLHADEKIGTVKIAGRGCGGIQAGEAKFPGQANFDKVTGFAAFENAEKAFGGEAANGGA